MSGRPPLIAAYKGPAGLDVLTFGQAWSAGSGRPLHVVTIYPAPYFIGMGRTDAEWVAYNREEAERLLAEAEAYLPEGVAEFKALPAESAARGLHDLMDAGEEPATVIVGSRKTRGVRHTALGSTAGRLLQGAPGPVALVPWDYDAQPVSPLARIGVAFVDTADGHAALRVGARIAEELNARLEVLSVLPDTRVAPSLGEPSRYAEHQRSDFEASLRDAAASVGGSVSTSTRILEGPVVDTLANLHPSDLDVLICGSRGYGPGRTVLLGGVSGRLLKHARIPVVVVPRD